MRNSLKHTLLFFTIIIIEGYIVLSTELLAIRQTIPFIGSGTDTISIIIAAILMPLAFGYHAGGEFQPKKKNGKILTVRDKLLRNIIMAALILLPGLSIQFLIWFFSEISDLGIKNRLLQTAIYSGLFLVVPVYLLGQTVPLITNYFSKERLAHITGKIMFFSTLGSFLGATVSTLVLMALFGVHHTVTLNFLLMSVLVILMSKRLTDKKVLMMMGIFACALLINANYAMQKSGIVLNNQYNTVITRQSINGDNYLFLNGNYSSMYNPRTHRKYNCIEFVEKIALAPIAKAEPRKDVLVIGAGGFTFGHNDNHNNFTYVDIDKDLKKVAEAKILEEPIGKNKTFIAQPARAFLRSTDKKYDLIYLDTHLGGLSIPEQLITREFFMQIKNVMKDKGILVTNFIASPNFNNTFSRSIDNTFRSVFPHVSRVVIGDEYAVWNDSKKLLANTTYIYRHEDDYDMGSIYTDDKNTLFLEKPKSTGP